MFNKIIYSIAVCVCISTFVNAETKPEKVVSIVKVRKPHTWYLEQMDLWKAVVDKNQSNNEAWMNYYMAVRMAHMTDETGKEPIPELKGVVEQIKKAIPNSYEANYIAFRDNNDFQYIEKAYEMAPTRVETYPEMLVHYETIGDKIQAELFATKWFYSGDLSQLILEWNYNMLMSVDNDGIIFTCGDMDTEPAWVLQRSKKIREDVAIMNVHLLRYNKEYRIRIFKELKLPEITVDIDKMSMDEFIPFVGEYFIKNISNRPVFFASTMGQEHCTKFNKDLFITGLAYRYAKERFDNIAVLKRNMEGTFLLDYLKMNFSNEPPDANVYAMNQNYLPAMLTLYQHYKESNELQRADNLKLMMTNIAKCAGTEKELQGYLNETSGDEEHFVTKVKLDVKQLEMAVRPIKGNLHARQNETTNAEYELFLTDLLKQHDFEKLNICKVYPVSWLDSVPKDFTTKDPKKIFENGSPTDANAPVQNISYEAAQSYCKWLTQVCNNDPKKKYKKVIFRLPTEQEWTEASKAGKNVNIYPWGDYNKTGIETPTNSLGCYLANFNATLVPAPIYKGKSKEPCNGNCAFDGALFPADVYSYWPNDFGLYNTIGNVAEMTSEKGVAKGGSWYHKPEESTIRSVQRYTGPAPWLGFRVFMEVIEQ